MGMSLSLLVIPALGCRETEVICVICFAMFTYGLSSGADLPLPAELSTNFSASLLAIINTVSASAGILAPWLVGLILKNVADIQVAWNLVFYLTAAICVFCGLIFVVFGTSERQEWDYVDEDEDEKMVREMEGSL